MRNFVTALLGLGMACAASSSYAEDDYGDTGFEFNFQPLVYGVNLSPDDVDVSLDGFGRRRGLTLAFGSGNTFASNALEQMGGQQDWLSEHTTTIRYEAEMGSSSSHWYASAGAVFADYMNDEKDDETKVTGSLGLLFHLDNFGISRSRPTFDTNVEILGYYEGLFDTSASTRYRINAVYKRPTMRNWDLDENNSPLASYWDGRFAARYRYENKVVPGAGNDVEFHRVIGSYRRTRGFNEHYRVNFDVSLSSTHFEFEGGSESDSLRSDVAITMVYQPIWNVELELGVGYRWQDSTDNQFDYESFRAPIEIKITIPL